MNKLLAVMLALFGIVAVNAAEVNYPESDPAITIDFPADWSVNEEGVLHAMPKDESLALIAMTVAAENFQEAVTAMGKELEELVGDYQEKTAMNETPVEYNGFKMWMSEGTGKVAGKDANIGITLLTVEGSGKATVLITLSDDEAEKKHGAAIKQIVGSLKPAK